MARTLQYGHLHEHFRRRARTLLVATKLDGILRGLKAETVIFTGVLTNQCVAATSKDASFRDYMPIVVEDCTGTTLPNLHDPAIEMMRVGWSAVSQLDTVMVQLAEFPLTNARPH